MTRELAIQLSWGPVGSSCCVTLHRAGREFSERDRLALESVAPHLRAARARIAAEAGGATNDGIGQELGISRHTVARHIERIYEKVGVRTRAAATRAALEALATAS